MAITSKPVNGSGPTLPPSPEPESFDGGLPALIWVSVSLYWPSVGLPDWAPANEGANSDAHTTSTTTATSLCLSGFFRRNDKSPSQNGRLDAPEARHLR